MKKVLAVAVLLPLALAFVSSKSKPPAPLPDANLILPQGFSATVVADGLGRTRHLVVTPQHDIYVRLARPVNGKGTLLLHEQDGRAETVYGFGNFAGTGVYINEGYLYTSSNSEVFRYKLDANNRVIDTAAAERIVTGLVDRGTHETKSITFDKAGNMYIPIGCPSNSCQEKDRQLGSPGVAGCPLLETTGGVWMFKKDKPDQTYKDGVRYATGLRNVVAVDWNKETNSLYVMQHGRDQLNTIFPDMYTVKDNAELPAECLFALEMGDNAGWPYTYYDPLKKKKMVAPEYGGDGKKEAGAEFIDPAAAFPAHMAPNGLLFYTGTQFPERYRNGAFIAFHGSWNRSPEPQKGYFVVFQPFKNGKASGDWEVFADNFSGGPEKTASGRAEHRPCGLAMGPDGSLYVSDDSKGTLYKISYTGPSSATKTEDLINMPVTASKKITTKPATTATTNKPAVNPVAPVSKATLAAGKAVYMKTCVTCHQLDGGGVGNLNPTLIKTSYVLGDKQRLINVVLKGMQQVPIDGEKYSNAMPAFNYFTDKQVADVTTYVRNSFGNKASAATEAEVKKARGKK